ILPDARTVVYKIEPICGRERGGGRAGVRRRNPDPAERERDPYRSDNSEWKLVGTGRFELSRFAVVSEAGARRRNPSAVRDPYRSDNLGWKLVRTGRFEIEPSCGRERRGGRAGVRRACRELAEGRNPERSEGSILFARQRSVRMVGLSRRFFELFRQI